MATEEVGETKTQWHDMMEEYVENVIKPGARKIAMEGEVAPILFVFSEANKTIALVETPFEDDNQKEIFSQILPDILTRFHASGYVFVIEAWMGILDKKGTSENARKVLSGELMVHDLPADDRIEAVLIMAVRKRQPVETFEMDINHDRDGKRVLSEWKNRQMDRVTGRFVVKDWAQVEGQG